MQAAAKKKTLNPNTETTLLDGGARQEKFLNAVNYRFTERLFGLVCGVNVHLKSRTHKKEDA